MLASARLALWSWTEDDVDEAFTLWGDPRVMRWVGPPHADRARTRDALEAARESEGRDGVCLWRLTRSDDGAALGCCGLQPYEGPGSRRPGTRWLELAFHLRPDAWGRGYATEAAEACLARARQLGATHVVAFAAWGNVASRRVLDKLGFVRDGAEDDQTRHLLVLHSRPMASAQSMEALVDELLADGKLTREELQRFESELLADGKLSVDERKQIDRLLQAISSGQVTVVESR